MDIDTKIRELAEVLYLPVTRLHGSEEEWNITYTHPQLPFLQTLADNIPKFHRSEQQTNAVIRIFNELLFYGFVRIDENSIFLIGPVLEVPIDNTVVQFVLKSLGLPVSQMDEFIEYYESTPRHSIYKFAQIVAYMCNLIHEENALTALDVLPEGYRHEIKDEPKQTSKVIAADEHLEQIVKSQEYEYKLYSYVYTGQYEQLKEFISTKSYGGETGVLSKSAFRQNKYLVITSIALASRAAARGGLNYNIAMQQADLYFQRVDEAQNFNELFDIHKQMLLTYTRLVADRKLGKPSPPQFLHKVHDYVEKHITEKITTTDIARELKINRSYLSSQFKKELQMDLSEYINQLKIDEAKRLMLTTDMPLSQIANALGFSSQSHFAAVFKKIENMTPTEFQKNSLPT